ncbi:hypothetical protein TRFO_31292 [Tritrichomonas foetus]|uniref:DUF3447 domain-containing protein n=1 Tax=Tritrichomonas foetus TaxID=1144522 RepID=A0A1J4JRT0_9EUKA|nr:hypothetical protein TRFO_31292 [Tritrichomonas foetus]|eukprot:OHT01739.1 hypothetical protein TRFO_31292 [Tritrichomonas foetus]
MIEYAAFYGSINIFKFLWLNNVQINTRIPNVAIAGGNYEIIHLIESKKTLNFDGCLDTAVKFHRNDLFTYLYETYDHQICDTTPFVCIEYYNIFAFSNILSYVVENYNNLKCLVLKLIYGVYFNSFINIFLSMVLHGNYEMIKLLLQSKSNIDINMPDTILSISLIFLLI